MPQVRAARHHDVAACAGVLAAAFHDDPGALVFEPDDARRARMLLPFFESFIAASLAEAGDIIVAGNPIEGVACWFGPERHAPSPEAMGAHGFGDVLEAAGPETSERLLGMVGELDRQHELLTSGPHLRLEFFGVLPQRQGSGVGSALIDHGHRRADELGLPCYLETFTQQNVRYYERRGYRIAGEYVVGAGVPVYGLIRPPGG